MKVLGCIGDINWLDYGGSIVFVPTGQSLEYSTHTVDAIHITPHPENDSEGWANHYLIERLKLVGDVATKQDLPVSYSYSNEWTGTPAERTEWWFDSLADMCESYGIDSDEFIEAITSENMLRVAHAYDVIGSYHGFHELSGGYEETIKLADYRKRFALPCYQARQRGVTVYV
jgi:hypothetical protein